MRGAGAFPVVLILLVALSIPAVVLTVSTRASKRKLAEDAGPRELRQWSGPPPPEPDPDDPTASWREVPGPPLRPSAPDDADGAPADPEGPASPGGPVGPAGD